MSSAFKESCVQSLWETVQCRNTKDKQKNVNHIDLREEEGGRGGVTEDVV